MTRSWKSALAALVLTITLSPASLWGWEWERPLDSAPAVVRTLPEVPPAQGA